MIQKKTKKPIQLTAEQYFQLQEDMMKRVMENIAPIVQKACKPSEADKTEGLLDYFANTALGALMTSKSPLDINGKKIPKTPTNLSKLAFEYARAMLKTKENL